MRCDLAVAIVRQRSQKETAPAICDKDADHALALKGNQSGIEADVELFLADRRRAPRRSPRRPTPTTAVARKGGPPSTPRHGSRRRISFPAWPSSASSRDRPLPLPAHETNGRGVLPRDRACPLDPRVRPASGPRRDLRRGSHPPFDTLRTARTTVEKTLPSTARSGAKSSSPAGTTHSSSKPSRKCDSAGRATSLD